jgi:hypothetical protein
MIAGAERLYGKVYITISQVTYLLHIFVFLCLLMIPRLLVGARSRARTADPTPWDVIASTGKRFSPPWIFARERFCCAASASASAAADKVANYWSVLSQTVHTVRRSFSVSDQRLTFPA